jgi:hypothetical protein
VQWGLKGDPKIDEMYQTGANIKDDPSNKSNKRGRITFATSGTDSRSTQVCEIYFHVESIPRTRFRVAGGKCSTAFGCRPVCS